jgi:nucleoside-diphosphate-sugar epimerase
MVNRATSRSARSIVVFGGSGFIGSYAAAEFAARGLHVRIADIHAPRNLGSDLVTYEYCDVRNPIDLDFNEPPSLVLNLAAVHRTPGHAEQEYYDTNVRGALNVVDWCKRVSASTLCFTSSISVYGAADDVKTEDSVLRPDGPYGNSKVLAEDIHRGWLNESGSDARLVIVRPAVVFGPGENGNFTRLAHALASHRFAYPGRTDVVKACGYVSDLIRAIDFALNEKDRELTFNYCYPVSYTIKDVCDTFIAIAGYDRPRRLPQAFVAGALAGGWMASVLGHELATVERVKKLLNATHVTPAELIKRGFIWETDLESGLRRWLVESPSGTFN